jgi:hypothetical protein
MRRLAGTKRSNGSAEERRRRAHRWCCDHRGDTDWRKLEKTIAVVVAESDIR